VDQAADSEVGLHMASTEPYDAAIIDIVADKSDGLSFVKKLRGQENYTPVLILGAKRAVDDGVKGLEKGDHDYLSRPFSSCQILLHVEMLIRDAPRSTESPLSIV
jgi:two-component system OmpR family response regulator